MSTAVTSIWADQYYFRQSDRKIEHHRGSAYAVGGHKTHVASGSLLVLDTQKILLTQNVRVENTLLESFSLKKGFG